MTMAKASAASLSDAAGRTVKRRTKARATKIGVEAAARTMSVTGVRVMFPWRYRLRAQSCVSVVHRFAPAIP